MIVTSGAATLDKGLALFNLIAADGGRTPLAEIAGRLDLPASTARRLATSLMRSGMISRIGHGRYDLSFALMRRLQSKSVAAQLSAAARPCLAALARTSGATTHLGIWENEMVTYLVRVPGRGASPSAGFTRENGQLEAYCSGLGKLLLAHLPENERENYLSAGRFVALTERTLTEPDDLRAHLRMICARGLSIDDGEMADDLFCLAVPIVDDHGSVIAAISASIERGAGHETRTDDLVDSLHHCAAKIGGRLGYGGR